MERVKNDARQEGIRAKPRYGRAREGEERFDKIPSIKTSIVAERMRSVGDKGDEMERKRDCGDKRGAIGG